jgi:diaminohydroxyphosphoribosylaminopyrimidine deaminase/5-amino-6-(5-phosphoribosylamino)uracil reductase
VLTSSEDDAKIASLIDAGAEVLEVNQGQAGGIDLNAALQSLANRGCNEVLVEAGPTLSGGFIEQGLVNELLIYIAPVVLGDRARSMLTLPGIASMDQRWNVRLHDCTHIGDDLRLRYRVA